MFRHILARALAKLYNQEEDVEEAPSNCNRYIGEPQKNVLMAGPLPPPHLGAMYTGFNKNKLWRVRSVYGYSYFHLKNTFVMLEKNIFSSVKGAYDHIY